ncbi:hypothetical protein [Clostridium scatologenes]|uniref:Uncharacterized protein n=1 Tax=Clostridium scatologenes TaxID=1548 RepID=A0A0E3JN81_CLOSL|nr:hypothetical protein [Clostridium scatologenes]AKA68892.1 hypothetical protein CSCA_1767 [Clostridium scatologenes]
MNSITNLRNSLYGLYLKNNQQYSNTQSLSGIFNNDSTTLYPMNISEKAVQLSNKSKQNKSNPLNSLVSNGTITQSQATAVNDAFQAALKLNLSRSYSSTPVNPIKSLVKNGTITQSQATAITNAYLSAYHSNQDTTQTTSANNSAHSTVKQHVK